MGGTLTADKIQTQIIMHSETFGSWIKTGFAPFDKEHVDATYVKILRKMEVHETF